jgi:glycosyltransferase involved in cell wall biosynthesis
MMPIQDKATLAEVRTRLHLPARFVLADALKNPSVLVRAWHRLPDAVRANTQIVFFSRQPNPLPVVFEAVESGIARLLVQPSRSDLVALYNLAELFVFPSWYEGFGIPIIEAMACGTPVIASDRYSIPEVAGGAALLMDAEDDCTLAEHLVSVLTDSARAQELQGRGIKRAADFSWEHTADIVRKAYDQAYHRVYRDRLVSV